MNLWKLRNVDSVIALRPYTLVFRFSCWLASAAFTLARENGTDRKRMPAARAWDDRGGTARHRQGLRRTVDQIKGDLGYLREVQDRVGRPVEARDR